MIDEGAGLVMAGRKKTPELSGVSVEIGRHWIRTSDFHGVSMAL
jgi:hypothetical protein